MDATLKNREYRCLTIFPPVVLVRVLVTAVVEHLNAVLIATGSLKSIIELNEH